MKFYERFRAEVGRYAEGVHHLGAPADAEAVKGLPDELASFLRSWNGASLFVDAVTIHDAAAIRKEDDLWLIGGTGHEDVLALDGGGRVLRLEEDTGEELVEGTSFAKWIEGTAVADAVIYDREGEFREDVYEEDGEELRPATIVKREKKYLKVDPGAPAPAWRLAKGLERTGKRKEAIKVLEAVEPGFDWAWFDLGRLREAEGDLAGAEESIVRAAGAPGENAAFFAAHAARLAAKRGDEAARAKHASGAATDPAFLAQQRRAVEAQLAEGNVSEAKRLIELVLAVSPRDVEALAMRARVR